MTGDRGEVMVDIVFVVDSTYVAVEAEANKASTS